MLSKYRHINEATQLHSGLFMLHKIRGLRTVVTDWYRIVFHTKIKLGESVVLGSLFQG